MGWTSTAAVWLLSRGLVLWLFFGPHSWVTGDVVYFAQSLARVPEVGLDDVLVEYPLPGVGLVALPWLIARWFGEPDLYAEVLLALALVTDAAFTVVLHRVSPVGRRGGVWVWLLAVPLLGATSYARFDLVPGVLAALSLLFLAHRPVAAAAAGALATGAKLWPALLLPALAVRGSGRRPVLITVIAVGALMVAATVVLAGWSRLVSPLTWQSDRGLQIESVLATPAMLAWAVGGPDSHVVAYSEHNAFEVTGPGVAGLLTATAVLSVLLGLGLAVLWARAWRRGDTLGGDAVVWMSLTAVTGFMVTSKVLSPQYLLWLLPVAAAGIAVADTRRARGRLRRWAAVLLVTTFVTQLVFPMSYGAVVRPSAESVQVVLLLAGRNLLLVWLLASAAAEAWWHVEREGRAQRGIPLDRQPPGPAGNDARTLR